MNYDLAKQLKDAGFPQEQKQGAYWFDDHKTLWIQPHLFQGHEIRSGALDVSIPTLSDLIEACGEEFRELQKLKNGFRAIGTKDRVILCDNSTPEEAVANLWLALNKHE